MDNPREIQDLSHGSGSAKAGQDTTRFMMDSTGEAQDTAAEMDISEEPSIISMDKDDDGSKNTSSQTSVQQASIPSDLESLYKSIDSYDWENDNVYQASDLFRFHQNSQLICQKRAVQNMSRSANLTTYELELRAKCFYWTRKTTTHIDFSSYRNWKLAQDQTSSTNSTHQKPEGSLEEPSTAERKDPEDLIPYSQNFEEVAKMIMSGQSHLLPGIKEISPVVLTDKITPPSVGLRKKPWESDNAESPAVTGGMFGDRRDVYIRQEL